LPFFLSAILYGNKELEMRKIIVALAVGFISISASAQLKMGNWAYSSAAPIVLNANNMVVPVNYTENNVISIKGMFNATPDAYVAIFSLSQEGLDEKTANQQINDKIDKVRQGLKAIGESLTLNVDIISFVPIYDQVLERKVFSKKSLTETPVGFELKKNIIIEYKNADQLNLIFSLCTSNGIYDYIRTDVVVSDMGKIKAQLRKSADSMIYMQLERYAKLRDIDIKDYKRTLAEGYTVVYPGEKYANYTAFSCTSYFTKKFNLNNDSKKKITRHYLPVIDKEFDFVVNPVVAEPAIQVMYQINLAITKKPKPLPAPVAPKPVPKKEFFFITPNGDLKQINV
jgi:uncharacterized protein YggE